MKIAITGGTGFVGQHLARHLVSEGHEVVLVSRGVDRRNPSIFDLPHMSFRAIGTSDPAALARAFEGCDTVAHLGGINRELGSQTYQRVHVQGTRNVVEGAKAAGVSKILLLSFLRARPACGSAYHESKWDAEEIVRTSGLDYTIFKAGVIYGRGDHLLDHISHALHTFPFFVLVGFKPTRMRPLAVNDLVRTMTASLVEGRLSRKTVPITGPEEMDLREVMSRIAMACAKHPIVFPAPVWIHYVLAWFFERTMAVPLEAKAQVRILSESMVEPVLASDRLPADLEPTTPFSLDQIRAGLPEAGSFGLKDCIRSLPASLVR